MTDEERIERMLTRIGRALADDFSDTLEPAQEPGALQSLEVGVSVLIAALAETKLRNREQIAEIETKNRQFTDRQAQLVRELSTPIIAIWDGVLALPLIGAIDPVRGQALLESVLGRVVEERARFVVIDMTGSRNVDAETAQYILRTARAVRLLGATCYLTGVSPEAALSLMQLDLQLDELRTTRRLSEALKAVFSELSLSVQGTTRKER